MLNPTLEKYKEYLLARKQSLVYFNYMRLFLKWVGNKQIDFTQTNKDLLTQFFTENKYSANAMNNFIKAGRDFYKNFLNINSEWTNMKLVKVDRKIPNYLTEKDLETAIKYMITYHSDLAGITCYKIKALLNLMFYTGLRKSEILNLKREDVDLEENSLIVRTPTKGKSERKVFFPESIKQFILDYFQTEEQNINAFNITYGQINYFFEKMKQYFPNKNITLHLFRHSFARNMIEKGIPIGVVSKLLGHASIHTTLIYTDPDEEQIKRIYKEKIK